MPKANVTTSFNKSISDLSILTNFIANSTSLAPKFQYLISEVVMLRLFGIYENMVSEVAFRLACGANYRNGNLPRVLVPCRSITDAYTKMLSHNRGRRPLPFLKWTIARYVEDSIKYVLDTSDSFYTQISAHSISLEEMRKVRNHIAHRTKSTAAEYNAVLVSLYSGNPRISVGPFLTSTNRHAISNISRYLQTMRIILSDITSG